jgi:hypothetical protein
MPKSPKCEAENCPCLACVFDAIRPRPKNGLCQFHAFARKEDWAALTHLLARTNLAHPDLRMILEEHGFRYLFDLSAAPQIRA